MFCGVSRRMGRTRRWSVFAGVPFSLRRVLFWTMLIAGGGYYLFCMSNMPPATLEQLRDAWLQNSAFQQQQQHIAQQMQERERLLSICQYIRQSGRVEIPENCR